MWMNKVYRQRPGFGFVFKLFSVWISNVFLCIYVLMQIGWYCYSESRVLYLWIDLSRVIFMLDHLKFSLYYSFECPNRSISQSRQTSKWSSNSMVWTYSNMVINENTSNDCCFNFRGHENNVGKFYLLLNKHTNHLWH